ncbi:MAG: YvcK family protein [Mycoplasmatales bacterium]|nr:YvcK family protein [Mycoplasmatales bacterium]
MRKKIAVLGGGTGLPIILKGIKYIDNIDIAAIVTVSDSGGSTGILSRHFNIPAIGDLRRVIAALSRDRIQLEKTMNYRFNNTKTDLDGHTMGNLFLATHVLMENNFAKGIKIASEALNIKGQVIPVSNEFNDLNAILDDGSIVEKEDKIGKTKKNIKKIFYKNGMASKEAINTILEADLIIFGIGSLFTSLIPNIIFPNMIDALKKTKAEIIYFSNIFTQYGETDQMTLSDHVQAIEDHTFSGILDKVIYSSTKIDAKTIKSYENDNQFLVKNDYQKSISIDLAETVITDDSRVRHNEKKIEKFIKTLL